MAQLRHIALAVSEPLALADQIASLFGLTKMRYDEESQYAFLTDGYMYLVLTRSATDGERSTDSLDHLGFYVDDVDEVSRSAENLGLAATERSSPTVRFYTAPDGWDYEFRDTGWAETIASHTQLLDLAPVPDSPPTVLQVTPVEDRSGLLRVGTVAELPPGRIARVAIANQSICVANVSGEYCAVTDRCPHMPRHGRISDGGLHGDMMICPTHNSCFDARTGELRSGPASRGLKTYEVSVINDEVWVNPSSR